MEIVKAKIYDVEYLLDAQLSLLYFLEEIDKKKKMEIIEKTRNDVIEHLEDSKILLNSNEKIGCYTLYKYLDGQLLDMIYLEENYRNNGVGTELIKSILKDNTYLWVYKENDKAINLYKKLGFKIKEETDTRYYMKYNEDNK